MTGKCPNCHKDFTILYPQMWAYKRNSDYFCSWKCLRATDKEKGVENGFMEKARMNKDQQKKAVQIALEGGNPLRWLEDCGSNNAPGMWYTIKTELKQTDPETYEKLPKRIQRKDSAPPVSLADAMAGMQTAADAFFGACEDMGLCVETPEAPKKNVPLQYDDYTVCCIESKTFGRFYWDRDHNHLDWTTAEGEEISFTPTGWKKFLEELPKVAEILGVTL